ncbi:MAG: hypothetical protein JXR36_14920, partial [Bacteroidales bacterium]|nr:hypothetical protein [Bacteroidales bacterium]
MSFSKYFFILLMFLFIAQLSKAEVLLNEQFTGAGFPTGWNSSAIQGTQSWILRSSPAFGSTSGGNYVVFDDFALGGATFPNEAAITSPQIVCSGNSNIKLNFKHYWEGVEGTNGFVEVSANGGTSWTTVMTYGSLSRGSLASPQDTTIDITAIAANQADVKIRFRYSDGSFYGKLWCVDDIVVYSNPDVGITDLIAPWYLSCAQQYTNNETITVRINNFSHEPISNVPITCVITGGLSLTLNETYSGTIAPYSFYDYTFSTTVDMSADAVYYFNVSTGLAGDANIGNNAHITGRQQLVQTYPYFQSFNAGSGGWLSGGTNPSVTDGLRGREFVHGTFPYLNGADGEGESWYIDVTTHGKTYQIWAESPVFDFTNLTNPVVSMDIKYQFTNYYSQAQVQYSINGGTTWVQLGTDADPDWYQGNTNWWYNNYTTPVNTWTNVQHELCQLSGEPCVKFRVLAYAYYGISGVTDYRDRNYFGFDNFSISAGEPDDIQPIAITIPNSGLCGAYPSSTNVQVLINNYTCRPVTNIPVTLQVDGGMIINEVIPGPIPRFGSYLYSFTNTIDISSPGLHDISITTNLATDGDNSNDNLTETRQNNIPINTFPYDADFESGNQDWVSYTPVAPKHFRLGDLPYLNGSQGNGQSYYVEVTEHAGTQTFWVESPVFDLTTAANPMLYMDIKYQLTNYYSQFRVDYSTNGGTTWTQLGTSDDPNWYQGNLNWWYNNFSSPVDEWTQVQHDLCNLAGQSCVKFRIVGQAYYGVSGTNDYRDRNYFAFDNFKIIDDLDVGVITMIDPNGSASECLYSANQTITILVHNYGCVDVNNVPVTCELTGEHTQTFNGTVPVIPGNSSVSYTFPGSFDMTPLGTYNFHSYTSHPSDINLVNDDYSETIDVNFPRITVYPYLADFNTGTQYWTADGDPPTGADVTRGRDFVHGTIPYLNGAEGEGDSWYVDVTTHGKTYKCWLESPVFDFSENTNPVLSMDIKYQLTNYYSQFQVQFSTNGGATWTQLGTDADPDWYQGNTNWWYNNYAAPVNTWTNVSHDLCELSGEPCVKFRIIGHAYYGISGVNDYRDRNYFAIDNFMISGGESDDAEPVAITLPDAADCAGYTNSETVQILVNNNKCRPLYDIPVTLVVNGTTTINEIIPGPIPRFGSFLYTFSSTIDLSPAGTHTLSVTTNLVTDGDNTNDNLTEIRINNPINTFPYQEDFNSDNGGWVSTTPIESRHFRHGELPYLNGSEGEGDSWFVEVTEHAGSQLFQVESPVFDLSGALNPMLIMDIKYQLSNYYTNFQVQYSTNGGSSWTQLGTNASPYWYQGSANWWYNNYSSPVEEWTQVQHKLCDLAGESCVKFRINGQAYYGLSGVNDYRDRNYFAFDNFKIIDATDVGVTAIIEPDPSDLGCLYSDSQIVMVRVYNWSCVDAIDVPVVCDITGTVNTVLIGTVPNVPAGSYTDFTFPTTFDMTGVGSYNFDAYTVLPGDINNTNDNTTLSITVDFPLISTFPYLADFNSGTDYWIAGGQTPSVTDVVRGREFVHGNLPYLSGPQGEGDSWYIDVSTHGKTYQIWVESPVFDFSALSAPSLYMDIKYQFTNYYSQAQVQYSLNGGTTWIQLGTNAHPNWYEGNTNWWYNNYTNPVDEWTQVQHNLCNLAGETCVKFRVLAHSYYGISGVTDYRDRNYFAFDNFRIVDNLQDVSLSQFISPLQSQEFCTFPTDQEVTIRVHNPFCNDLIDIPVFCEISGAITQSLIGAVTVPAISYVDYTFPTTVDMTSLGTYDFTAYVDYPPDTNTENDTIYTTINTYFPLITSFPYFENFNTGANGWIASGSNPPLNNGRNFELGSFTYLNGNETNGDSWYVDVSTHGSTSQIWVESPVLDFTTLTNPKLSFEIKYQLTNYYSQFQVQYSTNGGVSWTQLGNSSDPMWYQGNTNWWYDNYANPVDDWTYVEHTLCNLAGQSCVKLRVLAYAYYGISGVNDYTDRNRIAFDNILISDTPYDAELSYAYGCWGSAYNLEVQVRNNNNFCVIPGDITSIDLTYSIDGGAPVSGTFSGFTIAPGAVETIQIPNVTIPSNTSDIQIWCSLPNGVVDQIPLNDTIWVNAANFPQCNDHCSNAIELTLGTTAASQTSFATADPTEDPSFSSCTGVTLENTIWYYFTTTAAGGEVTLTFQNTTCAPSSNGIQVSVDELIGTPCEPAGYTNVFCSAPGNQGDIVWGPYDLPPNTTYYITIDGYANNDCDLEIMLEGAVTPPPVPEDPTVTATPNPICEGESSTIDAVSIGSEFCYVYTAAVGGTNLGATPLVVTPSSTTTYYVEAVSDMGVVNAGGRVPITITVDAAPDASITAAGPSCESDAAVNLTAATAGGTWSGDGITDVVNGTFDPSAAIIGNNTITYEVTVGTCTSTDNIIIEVQSAPDASITS